MTQNIPWSYDTVMKLIDLFHEKAFLWDTSLDDYRVRPKKAAAWQYIADVMKMDRQVVEKKVRMLVGQYRRELVKEASGVPSRWFAFSKLSFLGSAHDSANNSVGDQINQDIMDEKSEESSNLEYNSDLNEEISRKRQREEYLPFSQRASVEIENEETIPKGRIGEYLSVRHTRSEENEETSRRRHRDEVLSYRQRASGDIVDASRKRLREDDLPTSQRAIRNNGDVFSRINDERLSRDQYSVFGEHVANKLRNITNKHARATTEFLINKILYNAQLGNYDRNERKNVSNIRTTFVNAHRIGTRGVEEVIDEVSVVNEDIDPVAIDDTNPIEIKIEND